MSAERKQPSVFLSDPDVTLYHGDVLATLRELPAESVDCVVTSPPYWGLRDYGQEGQLGLEPTPEQYVERMVKVFREVRRVLAAHGTVWLNLGDSFYSSTATQGRNEDKAVGSLTGGTTKLIATGNSTYRRDVAGLKPKDLVGIPWRVAFALQADGWYLRSDIIWAKPNPMPESVTDRPTKAHEYVFLLSKQPRYFFDQEAVREQLQTWGEVNGQMKNLHGGQGIESSERGRYSNSAGNVIMPNPAGRNIRSVWEIATQPYPEAHFATFPEELARRCIAAGCPEQVCRVCGKARERIVLRDRSYDHTTTQPSHPDSPYAAQDEGGIRNGVYVQATTVGFTDCGHADYRPGIVLDPFIGSGTVAYVARKLGRHSIGIDLNAEYLALAARRLQQQSLFAETASGS